MQSGWGISYAFSSTNATCILQNYDEIGGSIQWRIQRGAEYAPPKVALKCDKA